MCAGLTVWHMRAQKAGPGVLKLATGLVATFTHTGEYPPLHAPASHSTLLLLPITNNKFIPCKQRTKTRGTQQFLFQISLTAKFKTTSKCVSWKQLLLWQQ